MRRGQCIKCGQATVYEVDTTKYADCSIPLSAWVAVGLTHYVCVSCGYTEAYALDKRGLQKIAKDKPRVPFNAADGETA